MTIYIRLNSDLLALKYVEHSNNIISTKGFKKAGLSNRMTPILTKTARL